MAMNTRTRELKTHPTWQPYIDARWGLPNYWYPAVFSDELSDGRFMGVQLLGERILLARANGKAYAVADQCAHKGARFSGRPDCHKPGTITCFYHGFTYDLGSGKLVDILTSPEEPLIGKIGIRTYAVQEAQGLVFVFVGDAAPGPLEHDVPPGFLREALATAGIRREVKSNWRVACENGDDPSHLYTHRTSPYMVGEGINIPVRTAGRDWSEKVRVITDRQPYGITDQFDRNVEVIEGGARASGPSISIWMPGSLTVTPWPRPGMTNFEWYVPIDDRRHIYFQVLAREGDGSAQARERLRAEVVAKWDKALLRGFNDDDIFVRENVQDFYDDDSGYHQEHLIRADAVTTRWRALVSKHNRGIKTR
jgi:carbazole 1,9a-dioxygenase terminal dioxygenase component